MQINKICPQILSHLYYYDISSCFFNILKGVGYDCSNLENLPKPERNKKIGLMQRDNKQLSLFLNKNVKSIINHYIEINNLYNNIIVSQKDGFISDKLLKDNNISLSIDMRFIILKLIITNSRDKYLCITENNDVIVKGLRNKPIDTSFFNLFKNINFTSNKSIINGVDKIRNEIYKSNNILWFAKRIDENYIEVPIKNLGYLKVRYNTLNKIDLNDIDKKLIWENMVWDFCLPLINIL